MGEVDIRRSLHFDPCSYFVWLACVASALSIAMARKPAYPNHVGTIDGTIRMGHGLWVHCDNRECLHGTVSTSKRSPSATARSYPSPNSSTNRSARECGARWPNISISLEPGGTRGAKMGYTASRE